MTSAISKGKPRKAAPIQMIVNDRLFGSHKQNAKARVNESAM